MATGFGFDVFDSGLFAQKRSREEYTHQQIRDYNNEYGQHTHAKSMKVWTEYP